MWGNTVKKSYWRRTGVRRAYIVAGVVLSTRGGAAGTLTELGRRLCRRQGECDPVRDRLGGGQGGLRRPGGYRYRKVTHTAVSGMLDSLGDERHN
jgi:hypothetical protein